MDLNRFVGDLVISKSRECRRSNGRGTDLCLGSGQEGQEFLMVVQLDIVVFRLPAVDLSLNLVSVVVQDKEVRVHTSLEHGADLLQGLLVQLYQLH